VNTEQERLWRGHGGTNTSWQTSLARRSRAETQRRCWLW
jgi:hypothetical protein